MGEPVIETRGLTKHYGRTVGVEGLDLTVARGEVFGFVGPNGAGKTTTIRLLLDLIRPTRGSARLLGRDPADPRARARVGYLPGDLALDPRLTGRWTLELLGSLGRRGGEGPPGRRRGELCERLELSEYDLGRTVREYSRGMRQKLALVGAMQDDPELLIFDEPTSGLDPLVRETVFELLQEAGAAGGTVFLSSHVMAEVERICGRVAVIREGRLLAVERTDELRRSARRRMMVRFAGPVPAAELAVAGVELVERDEHRAVLAVPGDLNPLLAVLARHVVEELEFPEPSLEEAFVGLYRRREEGEAP